MPDSGFGGCRRNRRPRCHLGRPRGRQVPQIHLGNGSRHILDWSHHRGHLSTHLLRELMGRAFKRSFPPSLTEQHHFNTHAHAHTNAQACTHTHTNAHTCMHAHVCRHPPTHSSYHSPAAPSNAQKREGLKSHGYGPLVWLGLWWKETVATEATYCRRMTRRSLAGVLLCLRVLRRDTMYREMSVRLSEHTAVSYVCFSPLPTAGEIL